MRVQWWRLSTSLLRHCQTTFLNGTQFDVCQFSLKDQSRSSPWLHQLRLVLSSSSTPSGSASKTAASLEKEGPLEIYRRMVAGGDLQHDARQETVAEALNHLLGQMREHDQHMRTYQVELSKWSAKRKEAKEKLLQEEATVEAERRIKKIADDQKKNRFTRWLSRKARNSSTEPGSGFMVARIRREKKLDFFVGPRPLAPPAPQGVYLYGNVGCGKTLLMDLFFKAADGVVRYRRRLHFHAAMLEVHHRMHMLWSQGRHKRQIKLQHNSDSSIDQSTLTLKDAAEEWLEAAKRHEREHQSESATLEAVADELLGSSEEGDGGASVLCFDEVQVLDVFTAVALAGILGRLLRRGAVIVATSNRAPWDLNKGGMQKELFAVFVAEIDRHCQSLLVGTDTDYRRVMAAPLLGKLAQKIHYFWPLDSQSHLELERLWDEVITSNNDKCDASVGPDVIPVMFGRSLQVPESCNGLARFTFEQACGQSVGAADYIALSQNYHTVFITDIPIMSMRLIDKARRFITLVDELYNHHCRLICTAAGPPDDLFVGTVDGPIIDLECLQFETEAEGGRLRRDVTLEGSVAPVGATRSERASLHSLHSGREEMFAFHRAPDGQGTVLKNYRGLLAQVRFVRRIASKVCFFIPMIKVQVSRLLEMQTTVYLQTLDRHPKYQRNCGIPTPPLSSESR